MEKELIIVCRHCSQKNKIDVKAALEQTDKITCGKCKKNIFLNLDEKIDFLDLDEFIHPMDASTMNMVKKIPAVNSILKFLVKHTYEKFFKVLHLQNNMRVSEKQFPEIYKLYKRMLFVLDFKFEPELFVYRSPYINAFTYGVEKNFIGISTAAIQELNEYEIMDILAHELGHIKLNHVLYKMAAIVVANLSLMLANKTLGIGGMLIAPLRYALLAWDRASELSADRIALLATKSLKSSHMLTLKLTAGIPGKTDYNYEAFLEQGEEARKIEDESILTKMFNFMQNSNTTHPFPVWRTGELDKWAKEGNFLKAISKNHISEKGVIPEKTKCPKCGNEYASKLDVCPFCGHTDKEEDKSFFDKIKDLF